MVKNGLLVCKGTGYDKNIGDYIQSLAAEMFFDKIDIFVEREELSSYKSYPDKTKVIMNGWFMWYPENFPPSNDIIPLFISFHIVPNIAEKMLTSQNVEYLKKYGPVGCRDISTQKLLEKYGIPCYFSGCLTLSLGNKYKSDEKSGEIIFVDPYYECLITSKKGPSLKLIVRAIKTGIQYPTMVRKICKSIKYDSILDKIVRRLFKAEQFKISWILKMERWFHAASFYNIYSKKFDDDLLGKAVFIKHQVLQSTFHSEEDKYNYAKTLLKRYAEAYLIITSRIHCALPSLALETPVIFTTSDALESGEINMSRSKGRFGGLSNLFLTMKYTKSGLVELDEQLKITGKINVNTKIQNKTDFYLLQSSLIEKCKKFVLDIK
jgi:hypothetical protein